MPVCAICAFLAHAPTPARGTVGVMTREPAILPAALDRFGVDDTGHHHVVVDACPEHVVDVYRERIDGVRMAWRLEEAAIPSHRRHEVTSASRA